MVSEHFPLWVIKLRGAYFLDNSGWVRKCFLGGGWCQVLGRPREWYVKGLWRALEVRQGRLLLWCTWRTCLSLNCLHPSPQVDPRKVGFAVESSSLPRECMLVLACRPAPIKWMHLLLRAACCSPRGGNMLEVGVLLLDQGTGWSFLHQKCLV